MGGAILHPLDVLLHRIQCDVPHKDAKALVASKRRLLEGNFASQGRFQRERGVGLYVDMNKLLKLAIRDGADR